MSRAADHPRSRGEYDLWAWWIGCGLGSSPLSRGIPADVAGVRRDARIIPALAGNTWSRSCPGSAWEGSSPLSRGIPTNLLIDAPPRRIIPALAGNTQADAHAARLPPDHPRSRGEYHHVLFVTECRKGSSPLSRGIRFRPAGRRLPHRIIPALAGNTKFVFI